MADPRIERTHVVVRRAALDELGEVGYGAFTIESVAARAGVGKSTIYRHWPDRVALIADAFESYHEEMVPDIEGVPPRVKVERLIRHVAEVVVHSTFSVCIPALIEGAERDERLRRFHHHYSAVRRRSLVEVLGAGVESGDFPATTNPELAALALLGPIFYRRLMSPTPFSPDEAPALVATVLGPVHPGA